MAGSSASQSSGQSTGQSYSDTYIPDYSETPILEEIAQHARSMSDQVYNWGMNVYNSTQGNIDGMLRDALSYASPQRISVDMGMAESGVAQGVEAGRQNAIRDLQSYGVDPSMGRYAGLDIASRVMGGAATAGAGNQQRMADQAAGNVMRNQAISAGLQNANFGLGVGNAANAYLNTASQLKYPPLGHYAESTNQSTNESKSGSVQTDPPQSGKGGGGGKQPGGGGGGQKQPSGGGGKQPAAGKPSPTQDPSRTPPGGPKAPTQPGPGKETPSGMDLEFNPFGDNQRQTGMDMEFNPFGDNQRQTGMDLEFNPFGDNQTPTGMDQEFNPFPAQEPQTGMDQEFNPLPAPEAQSGMDQEFNPLPPQQTLADAGTYDPYAGGVSGMDQEFNPFAAPAAGGRDKAVADAGQTTDQAGSVYGLGDSGAWTGEGLMPAAYTAPQADFGGQTWSDIGQGTPSLADPGLSGDYSFDPSAVGIPTDNTSPDYYGDLSGYDYGTGYNDPGYGNFNDPTNYGDYGAGYNDPGYSDYGDYSDPYGSDYSAGDYGDYGDYSDYYGDTSGDYYGDTGTDYSDPNTYSDSGSDYADTGGDYYSGGGDNTDYSDSGGDYSGDTGGDYYSGGDGEYDYSDSGGDYARGGPVRKGRPGMPFPMARMNGRPPRRPPPTGYRPQPPGFRRGGPMPSQGMRRQLDPPKPMPGRRGPPGRSGGPMPAMPGNFISANGMPPPATGGMPPPGPPMQAPRAPTGLPPMQPRPPQRPPQQQFAGGGQAGQQADPTTGGFVSRDLSPSGGSQTDDVNARLNAGEFVIPKDVAAWKGKEFFYKLIAQARKLRSAGGQPEKPKVGYAGGGTFNPGMMQGAATRPLSSYQTPAQLPVNQRPMQSPFGRGMQ